MQNILKNKQILLVGNPNVGKSTVFNLLCNKNQKTGNYAGVTVASHSGNYEYKGEEVEVIDLPGSYSVYPTSEDEAIFSKFLVEEQHHYSGVIYILEALSIKRGLLLFQQIQDLGIPVLLVVNQIDQAERRGVTINLEELSKELGVTVLQTNAKQNLGIEELREEIFRNNFSQSETVSFEIPLEQKGLVFKILSETKESNQYKVWTLLASETYLGKLESVKDQMNQ
ncbi:MAG: FeoB small GTPase domain-containing protein, partial [Kaistella sp.]